MADISEREKSQAEISIDELAMPLKWPPWQQNCQLLTAEGAPDIGPG
jgi:hypothetical protein